MNGKLMHMIAMLSFLAGATAHAAPPDRGGSGAASAPAGVIRAPLTIREVNAAQQAWCDGLVSIAKAHADGKDYKSITMAMLSNNYNYDNGVVLFKPTLTFGDQTFRLDKEGAAAYFVGGNPKYPNDAGFALKPWVKCTYTNAGNDAGVLIEGDIAATMGNVYLTDTAGTVTTVDKFFAFKRGPDGKLKIIVHKSALPYKPA
jgi:hypothetical protein